MSAGNEDAGSLRGAAVVAVQELEGGVVVRLSGELDLHNSGEVRTALEAVAATDPRRIVVDLSAVEFVDSTLLSVLVEARRNAGDAFRVAAPGQPIRRVLDLAGVETYLDVHDTVEDALL